MAQNQINTKPAESGSAPPQGLFDYLLTLGNDLLVVFALFQGLALLSRRFGLLRNFFASVENFFANLVGSSEAKGNRVVQWLPAGGPLLPSELGFGFILIWDREMNGTKSDPNSPTHDALRWP